MVTKLKAIYRVLRAIMNLWLIRFNAYIRKKRGIPQQTSVDRKIFKSVFQRYVGKRLRVFEWGMGRSTIYYSRYLRSIGSDFEWYSIDNSHEWMQNVDQLVHRYKLTTRVHLRLSEFPAFWELPSWSWEQTKIPREDLCGPKVVEYVEYPRQVMMPKGFDVIIIDGRYRRRCLLTAFEVLAPGGVVILHDAERIHYHSSLENYISSRFFNSGKLPRSEIETKTWVGTLDRDPFIEGLTV